MTCIIGLIQDGQITMGGDRCVGNDYGCNVLGTPKIIRMGELLIGVAGDIRMLNIIRYRFQPPLQAAEQADDAYIATDFVDALHELADEEGYTNIVEGQDQQGSNLLVAYRGSLYTIGGLFEVVEYARSYAAIGTGRAYALGSLRTTASARELSAAARVRVALETAAEFDYYVRGPFDAEAIRVNDAE